VSVTAPTAASKRKVRETELRADLARERDTVELLSESVADLERQLFDPGWVRLTALSEVEFQPEGLRQLRALCRVYALKQPLIKRGIALRSAYIHGQGVEVAARADGRDRGEQDVNAVIQAFLDDRGNRRAVTGPAAREQLERALCHDGEIFVALFTRPTTGTVQARVVVADDIADVICNPDDATEPWYYHRRWNEMALDMSTGTVNPTLRERFYPAVGYRPAARPASFGGVPIAWDSPMVHLAVNVPLGWRRGVPDAYAAIDWAKAYKEFLEDWARLVKSLSRFAWRLTAKGQAAGQARAKIAAAPSVDPATGLPLSAGATAIMPADAALEAIPKSGATIDAESGRPLAMMVAAALGVPVTMLLADPGQTGARATAETLDQPTRLEMAQRQTLWSEFLRSIFDHVIAESVRAPKGALKGKVTRDENGRETTVLLGDTPDTIDIMWPELDTIDPLVLVQAIVQADSTGTVRPEEILRFLLAALGSHRVDELVAAQLDDDGNFIWPTPPAGVGPLAAGLARAGQDSASAGVGPMAGGGDTVPNGDGATDVVPAADQPPGT